MTPADWRRLAELVASATSLMPVNATGDQAMRILARVLVDEAEKVEDKLIVAAEKRCPACYFLGGYHGDECEMEGPRWSERSKR